jgi:hypothetical protein
MPLPDPSIHIDRTPVTRDRARHVLTLTDQGTPDRVAELAGLLMKNLSGYASDISLAARDDGSYRLEFENDKQDLSKWELGRINKQAMLQYMDNIQEDS